MQEAGSLAALAGEALGQEGHDLVDVAHDAEVGDAEDRRELVFVDGDDVLALLHAGEVLDGSGDAEREVYVGTHGLAGLAHLTVVLDHAGVHHGA